MRYLGDEIDMNEMGRACMGQMTEAYRVLVGKLEGKTPLGRRRRRWKDDIKMDLQKVGLGFDWINLAYDKDKWLAVANTVMNLRLL